MDSSPSMCTAERLESTSQCEPIHHSPSIAPPTAQPLDLPPMTTLSNTHQQPQHAVYINPNWTKKRKLKVTTSEMERLLAENTYLRQQLNASNTHCTMAMSKIGELKRKLNVKEGWKKKSTTVNIGARWITSGEGLAQFDVNIKAQKEKKENEASAKAAQEQAAATRQRKREARGPTDEFKGSLSAMRKDNLVELATTLELSVMDGNGKPITGKMLVINIKEHFEVHPEKKGWSRFRGLFSSHGANQRHPDGGPSVSFSQEQENAPMHPNSLPTQSLPYTHHFSGPSIQAPPSSCTFGMPIHQNLQPVALPGPKTYTFPHFVHSPSLQLPPTQNYHYLYTSNQSTPPSST